MSGYSPTPRTSVQCKMSMAYDSIPLDSKQSVIHAAWSLLVSAYSASNTVDIGPIQKGREASTSKCLEFANGGEDYLKVHLTPESTMGDILEVVQKHSVCMQYTRHIGLQDLPSPLCKEAGGSRCLSGVLMFAPSEDTIGKSQKSMQLIPAEMFQQCGIVLTCDIQKERVNVEVLHTDIIELDQVHRFVSQLDHLQRQIGAYGSFVKIKDLEIISPDDMNEISKWNAELPPAIEGSVVSVIENWVSSRADSVAIQSWDGNLTYHDLDKLSSRLARYLTILKVSREEVVPICFEKSSWAVLAMLAALKAGGAFVLLDPTHPRARLEAIIRQLRARIVLCSQKHLRHLVDLTETVFPVNDTTISELINEIHGLSNEIDSKSLAYVVFTSGSTGVPKGVAIEHEQLITSCLTLGQRMNFNTETRMFQFASYTFDACILEIFATLCFGGCICVPSDLDRLNDVTGAMNLLQITHALLTPSVLGHIKESSVKTLQTMIIGGENVPYDLAKKWTKNSHVFVAYGPAECTVACLLRDLASQKYSIGNIGNPVNCVCWIADPTTTDKLCAIGTVGELLIEGPMLARGYLNDVVKTDAAFIYDPVWLLKDPNSTPRRLYKTGDLVRYNADSSI